MALNKREIIPRINRWALILLNYDYELEYPNCERMKHVDALSRVNNKILVLEKNNFKQTYSFCAKFGQNHEITEIRVNGKRE